jgi:hypothetical protein
MAQAKKDKKKKNLQLKLAVARYYKLITVALIIVIIALSYYFILEPKYQEVGVGGRYDLDNLQQEFTKRENYLRDLKKLAANYQEVNQTDIEKLKKILPEEKDIPGLFVQLQALAEEYNFLLVNVSINESAEAAQKKTGVGGIKKLSISLNLISSGETGDYDELKEFLTTLEHNLRLFDVNAVYFSPESPNYTLDIFTYYYQSD